VAGPEASLVNEQLIAERYAWMRDGSPNVRYAQQFAWSQQAARDGGLGLWSACLPVPDDGEDAAVTDRTHVAR
jgi:endonuclease YncB( thermonuclease family)